MATILSDPEHSAENAGPAEIAPWRPPAVHGPVSNRSVADPPPTAGELEAIQKEAYAEAYATGLEEGRAAGREQLRRETAHLAEIVNALARPFDELGDEVEKQVVDLAMIVVRHLYRRAIKTDPAQIIGVVRRALNVLPASARDVRLFLHPDDAAIVNESLADSEGERAWRIVEDPMLTRGGCRVATDASRVDARVESRLAEIVSAIAGDDRGDQGS